MGKWKSPGVPDADGVNLFPILSNIFRNLEARRVGKFFSVARVWGPYVRVAEGNDVGETGGVQCGNDFAAAIADADASQGSPFSRDVAACANRRGLTTEKAPVASTP